jgi:hypothetical protein
MPRWYNEVREEWSLPLDMTFSREVWREVSWSTIPAWIM